jgi:hypothetical protein
MVGGYKKFGKSLQFSKKFTGLPKDHYKLVISMDVW